MEEDWSSPATEYMRNFLNSVLLHTGILMVLGMGFFLIYVSFSSSGLWELSLSARITYFFMGGALAAIGIREAHKVVKIRRQRP